MVKRRAISREDKALEPKSLPHLFQSLVPLLPARHGTLHLSNSKSYDFASTANAVPLTAEEFPMALRNYPIVFSGGDAPMPLALVGVTQGTNDFVAADGSWQKGAYVPAYLRKYPFAFVRESKEAKRNVLCADLSSTAFTPKADGARPLFEKDEPSQVITDALDFCNRFETALARTRAAMTEFSNHGLIGPSTVTISKEGKSLKIEGFQTLSEEKLRELPDDVLAGFVRRGLSSILSAHFMSLSNFSSMAVSE